MTEVVQDVSTNVVQEPAATLSDRFSALLSLVDEQTKAHTTFMKSVNVELKSLQKELTKLQPKTKRTKRTNVDGEKKNNVFDNPVDISDELCSFLNLEKGKQYSRQFVTNSLFAYVKNNELQNPENRRFILLDTTDEGEKLNELLKPDQPLTFFNMQRYLKPHYPKSFSKDSGESSNGEEPPVNVKKPARKKAVKTEESVKVEEPARKKAVKTEESVKVEEPVSVPPSPNVVPDADVVLEDDNVVLETKKKTRRAATRKGS